MIKNNTNGTLKTNILSNEYHISPSTVNFKIENHMRISSYEKTLNKAELTALIHERLREEEENKKKLLIEKRDKIIKENLRKVNQNKKQTKVQNEIKKQEEKLSQKEKLENFNKDLRSKFIVNKNEKSYYQIDNTDLNFKKNIIDNNNDKEEYNREIKNNKIYNYNNIYNTENDNTNDKNKFYSQKDIINSQKWKDNTLTKMDYCSEMNINKKSSEIMNKLNSKDLETFSFNDSEGEIERPPQPTEKMKFKIINKELSKIESVIDIREDIDMLIKRKLDLVKNNLVSRMEPIENNHFNNNEENYITNNHQKLSSFLLNNYNTNNNNNYIKNNINQSLSDTSICNISNISNKNNFNSLNNLKNNLIQKIIAKPDNEVNLQNNKNNKYSIYNFSTNFLNTNRINDSILSEFSNDNANSKNNKTNSSSKNDFIKNKTTFVSNEMRIKTGSKLKMKTKLKSREKISDMMINKNRISSANKKIKSSQDKSFYKITSTSKSVNKVKNSIINRYYTENTQNTIYDNVTNDKFNDCNSNYYLKKESILNVDGNLHKNINNNDTSYLKKSHISDLNIKSILEKNVDAVKNFRKGGIYKSPKQSNNNILNIIKDCNIDNSNSMINNNPNQFYNRKNNHLINDTGYNPSNKLLDEFNFSNKKESKSKNKSKLNVNLHKRRYL